MAMGENGLRSGEGDLPSTLADISALMVAGLRGRRSCSSKIAKASEL